MSIYSLTLKGLLNKQLDEFTRVQLSYLWLNSFVRKKSVGGVKSICSPKLNVLLYKQLDAIGMLCMQLSYSWLNNFF